MMDRDRLENLLHEFCYQVFKCYLNGKYKKIEVRGQRPEPGGMMSDDGRLQG